MNYPGKYIEINFIYENSISINISWIIHTARLPKLYWWWDTVALVILRQYISNLCLITLTTKEQMKS